MDITFTTAGALIGLALSIFLIIKKIQPAYSLIIGALIGGLIGSGDLVGTVEVMITGAQGMMSSVIRILTSGILAGALIKTGAAEKNCRSHRRQTRGKTHHRLHCHCYHGHLYGRRLYRHCRDYRSPHCFSDWQ